jgi:hypothetical protein
MAAKDKMANPSLTPPALLALPGPEFPEVDFDVEGRLATLHRAPPIILCETYFHFYNCGAIVWSFCELCGST